MVVMTWPMLGWPHPLWVQTSAQFHQQFTWAGLIAGTAACWYAVQFHQVDRIWVQPRAPRLGAPVVVRHLTVLVCWWVGAYVVALVPLVVATLASGGVGAPDPLVMVSGVLAMMAAVMLGYALGTVLPALVMVPITAAGFYALLVVGHAAGDSYAVVAPVLFLEPELGQRESPVLVVFRIAVFVAVAVAGAGLAIRCLHRVQAGLANRTGQRWRRAADIAMYAAVPAVLITGSVIQRPAVFAVDEQPLAVCEVHREIRYCVHTDQQARLPALIDSVDPVIARYGTTPDVLTQVWDQSLAFGPIDVDVARTLQIAFLKPNGAIETDIPGALAGIYSCAYANASNDNGDGDGGGTGAEPGRVADVPGDVLRFLAEPDEPPSGVFAGMPVADVQTWIRQHQQQLHTCTLTARDLPQP
ncbi:hypothetical protein [Actinophytocola glycyrrhizae]|uniref:ABC transporter permease n=1 Tax=Actinophytocola glycyrrhizae TaxID=2044873 RepID=A0ABV9SFF9_9PSEU